MRVRAVKAGVVVCVALFTVLPSLAMAATSSGGSPGQGLEISPPIEELSANPGQSLTFDISVRDVTHNELIATAQTDDFGASSNETGVPQLLLNETGATRYSLRYWIQPPTGITLDPLQLKNIPITINVPANAEPGGHYGVVRFTAVPASLQGTGVALSASVGTLILLSVNGAVTHSLSMVQFATGQYNATTYAFKEQSFVEHGPLDFLVRIQNNGTVHEQPIGTIVVKDMLGKTLVTLPVNADKGNILPDSIRRFTATLTNQKLFGYYTANLSLTYDGTKTLSDKLGFWVIPWMLILLILVGLVVLYYLLRLGMKRYNDHIIRQAKRR